MRRPGVWVLSLFVAATAVAQDEVPCVVEVDSVRELERVIDRYRRADLGSCNVLLIRLAPGDYHLTPSAAVDSSCGNCEDPDQRIAITVGLEISGMVYGSADQLGEVEKQPQLMGKAFKLGEKLAA